MVATDDFEAADRLTGRIAEATERLTDFPESGTPRPELGPGIRSLVVGRYLVLYRVGADSVDVVRIVHGARELRRLLRRLSAGILLRTGARHVAGTPRHPVMTSFTATLACSSGRAWMSCLWDEILNPRRSLAARRGEYGG